MQLPGCAGDVPSPYSTATASSAAHPLVPHPSPTSVLPARVVALVGSIANPFPIRLSARHGRLIASSQLPRIYPELPCLGRF